MAEENFTGLEPEAEEMLKAFPKNPVVCADLHSIAISLKRLADAVEGNPQRYGLIEAILETRQTPQS
jgi:hypothetical protein